MKIYSSVSELVGNTPMLRLSEFARAVSAKGHIFAKLEYLNPAGSIKDRVALGMIEDAERRGLLSPSSVIIEPTSGNTGIGLAAIGVSRGYRVIIVMPDTMSAERIKLMRAYGAEVVLTDGSLEGISGLISRRTVFQSCKSGLSRENDRPRDSRGNGRKYRCAGRIRRYRRYDNRGRQIYKGAYTVCKDRRS